MAKAESILTVAAYGRVSTDSEEQLNALENQNDFYREYIARHPNWCFYGLLADEGVTGTSTDERKAFHQLIQLAVDGKINLIVTKEVSRFARNTIDTLLYTRMLMNHGVGVVFINDNIDTRDLEGEFRLTIMASIAQEESRKISSRVTTGMRQMMKNGFVFAGTVYGFHIQKGVITRNESEGAVQRMMYRKFLEGKGCTTIAKELIQEEVPVGRRMKRWSAIAVARILGNEKNVGDLLQQKTITPDYLTHKSVKNKGQKEMIYIKDHHQGNIDRETWEAYLLEKARRGSLKDSDGTRYTAKYWCSGKLVCGECGSHMVIRTKKIKSGVYRSWICKEAFRYGELRIAAGQQVGCDNNTQINEKAIRECVKFALHLIAQIGEDFFLGLENEIQSVQGDRDHTELDHLLNEVEKLKAKTSKVIDLYLEGTIDKAELDMMKKKYKDEITACEALIRRQEQKKAQAQQSQVAVKQIALKAKEIFDGEDADEFYNQILDRIIKYKDSRVDVYFKYISTPVSVEYKTSGRGVHYKTICFLHK